jgi:serine/threonine protein kinase
MHHPNIVKFLAYEHSLEDNKAHIFTEYCDGGDLSKYIKADEEINEGTNDPPTETEPQLTRLEAWSFLADLAAALAYCHHGLSKDAQSGKFYLKNEWQPILHRDIKPENGNLIPKITVTSTRTHLIEAVVVSNSESGPQIAKLCDLGWAKVLHDPTGRQTKDVGSPRYQPDVGFFFRFNQVMLMLTSAVRLVGGQIRRIVDNKRRYICTWR